MLVISVLFVISISLTSCKKEEEKFCWICVTTVKQTVTGQTSTTGTSNSTICDQTEGGIRKLEQSAQNTSTSTVGGFTATITTTMKCLKQH